MGRNSAVHWVTTRSTRKDCFEQGYAAGPLSERSNPYKLGSYQYREYSNGTNVREGYDDYPEWKCVWKRGCPQYKAYEIGYNRGKNKKIGKPN